MAQQEEPHRVEDVMHLSRTGDIPALRSLFATNLASPRTVDEQGITPLHWAAINNQLELCRFLIENGADINAIGGDALATPAMWAAQRSNYYVVDLLLRKGANCDIFDASGYNILHLATFEGNVFLLMLLLYHGINVDVPDLQGHTSLMWAAYKGFPACIELFLRWSASIDVTDKTGFTALHWALVKGSQPCIQKLLEYGSDRFKATADGKTPDIIAGEMKTSLSWHSTLSRLGFDTLGHPKVLPFWLPDWCLTERSLKRILFFWPFVVFIVAIRLLSVPPLFLGVALTALVSYFSNRVLKQLISYAPVGLQNLNHTPYLAGIFAGSLFWTAAWWLIFILKITIWISPFSNLLFAGLVLLCSWFYSLSMMEDPGYIPRLSGRIQQKSIIDGLLREKKFDSEHFCTSCVVRIPLRAKHCKRCSRCVAKHDHHCPWIDNCVGINNSRHFVLYILTMQAGIIVFVRLCLIYLAQLPDPPVVTCYIFSERVCTNMKKDPTCLLIGLWIALQLTWVTMLVIVQLVQIGRGITTWESMKGNHLEPKSAATSLTSIAVAGSTSLEDASLNSVESAGGYQSQHRHSEQKGALQQWKRLLGIDTFLNTAFKGKSTRVTRNQPHDTFSYGFARNCADFWWDVPNLFVKRSQGNGRLGGKDVNYYRFYNIETNGPSQTNSIV